MTTKAKKSAKRNKLVPVKAALLPPDGYHPKLKKEEWDGEKPPRFTRAGLESIAKVYHSAAGEERDGKVGVLHYLASSCFPLKKNDMDPTAQVFTLEMMESLAPRDTLESLICAQLIATHAMGMDFLRRAVNCEQSKGAAPEAADRQVNRATKLLRTFAMLSETLRAKRAKGTQRVIVRHVTVNQGGQAIVGPVVHGGRGDGEKTGG